ncbi:MAG: hypothetical protein ACRDVZ_05190, partial [Jiangellaceae bacterium]
SVRAFTHHPLEHTHDVRALCAAQVGDEHAGDRVAAQASVPQLLPAVDMRSWFAVSTTTSVRPASVRR